jgi:hypothetical protein
MHYLLRTMYFILRDWNTSTDRVTSVPAGLLSNRGTICGRDKIVFYSAERPDRFYAYPSLYSIPTDSIAPREWSWPFTSIC